MTEPNSSPALSDKPLVSGVIIFLNAARYFEEAIESVFAQTYENWELILVDDGSTDASTAIAKRYAESYPERVRYVEHPGHENRGMSASRNLGIKNGRGAYIALLDADDVWLPHKLKEQVAILNSQPEAMMMYGRTRFWSSWSGRPEDTAREWLTPLGLEPDQLIQPPHLLTHFLRHEESVPSTCSVLIRRELFARVGYLEEEFRSQYEDLVFHAKASLRCPIYVASGCWDQYRQHCENSVAQAKDSGEFHAFMPNPAREKYLKWVFDYVASQGVRDTQLNRALARELWPYRHPVTWRLLEKILFSWIRFRMNLGKHLRQSMPSWLHYAIGRRLRGSNFAIPKHLVEFGNLRRLWPVSDAGHDRGLPVIAYYTEQFLSRREGDVKGCVLEWQTDSYTRKLGGDRVTKSQVAGAMGESASTDTLPSDEFDCVIIGQALAYVADAVLTLKELHRILKPGGVLLAVLPGIAQAADPARISASFQPVTRLSADRLFAEVFPKGNIHIEGFGNVLTTMATLHGIAVDELHRDELDHPDPRYDVIIGIRATKPRL